MKIEIETTAVQDASLERSRRGSPLTQDLKPEDFVLKVCTEKINEYVDYWNGVDRNAALSVLTLEDLKTAAAAKQPK